jgi:hypothetical protein
MGNHTGESLQEVSIVRTDIGMKFSSPGLLNAEREPTESMTFSLAGRVKKQRLHVLLIALRNGSPAIMP